MTPESPPFTFHQLEASNLPLLHDWLQRPHVREWWGDPGSLREVTAHYLPCTQPGATTRAWIAHLGTEPIGFIQDYVVIDSGDGWWENETDPGARGIDQYLANPEQLGRGLGSAMVAAFVRQLFADPSVTQIQTDPSPHNLRAIRSYQRAGFVADREVVTPDGPALLMRIRRTHDGKVHALNAMEKSHGHAHRSKLGSLLSDLGRQARLSEEEFALLKAVRDNTPAR